jgi:hypothetical protein
MGKRAVGSILMHADHAPEFESRLHRQPKVRVAKEMPVSFFSVNPVAWRSEAESIG